MTKTTCTFCSESFITSTGKTRCKECRAHVDAEWEKTIRTRVAWHTITVGLTISALKNRTASGRRQHARGTIRPFINTNNEVQPAPERKPVAIDMQQINTKGK